MCPETKAAKVLETLWKTMDRKKESDAGSKAGARARPCGNNKWLVESQTKSISHLKVRL